MLYIFLKYIATVIVPALLWPIIRKTYKHFVVPAPVKINKRLKILNKHCDEYLTVEDQYRSHKDEEYIAYKKTDAVMRCVTGVVNREEREIFKEVDMKCNSRVSLYNLSKILKYLSVCDDKPNLKFNIKKFKKDRLISVLKTILNCAAMVFFIIFGAFLAHKGAPLHYIITCFFGVIISEVSAIICYSKVLSDNDVDKIFIVLKEEGVYEDIDCIS